MRTLGNVLHLGVKEIHSVLRDPVLMGLILYTFTLAIYTVAENVQTEVRNAAIAIVDEDRSALSTRLRGAFLPPYFQPAEVIGLEEIDRAMDTGRYTFVLDIPPGFQADLQAGFRPTLQLNVDATAMTLAGNGATYAQNIIRAELLRFETRAEAADSLQVDMTIRAMFNPNLMSSWFMSVMQIVNNITILAIILSGAAVIRERERGTIDHLLVMPVSPLEIMLAKVWANGLVILLATLLSIRLVVEGLLSVPIVGSVGLFALGALAYLFAVASMGILLSTFARTMPQFGLLSIPVFVVLNLLSGGATPFESMPAPLRAVMQAAPSTHFNAFAQAVLYRGAGLAVVWPQLLAITVIGGAVFGFALSRFRRTMSATA